MDEEFEVKSSEELESMSEEDRASYEQALDDYTQKNFESELDKQQEEEDSSDEELEKQIQQPEEPKEDYLERYKGASRKINELQDELKRLRESQTVRESQPEKNQEVFDPEEYRELLDRNPAKAADYYYNTYVKPQMEQENHARTQEQQIQQAQETTLRSVNEFSKLENVQKVMNDKPELGDEFGKFLRENIQPPRNGYTVDDLKRAWNWFRYEDNLNEVKENTKRDTVKQLNDANPDVVTLTNAKDSKAINVKKMNREQASEYGEGLTDEELEKELEKRLG